MSKRELYAVILLLCLCFRSFNLLLRLGCPSSDRASLSLHLIRSPLFVHRVFRSSWVSSLTFSALLSPFRRGSFVSTHHPRARLGHSHGGKFLLTYLFISHSCSNISWVSLFTLPVRPLSLGRNFSSYSFGVLPSILEGRDLELARS